MNGEQLHAELERYVTLEQYPTTSADLVATAAGNHAPDEVLDRLRALPPGSAYASVDDLWEALEHTG
jgi:hypothetical protein